VSVESRRQSNADAGEMRELMKILIFSVATFGVIFGTVMLLFIGIWSWMG